MIDPIGRLSFALWLSDLQRRPKLDHRQLRRMLCDHQPAAGLTAALPPSLDRPLDLAGRPEAHLGPFRELSDVPEHYGDRAEACRKKGIGAVCLGWPDYPARLGLTDTCPLVLYYRSEDYDRLTGRDFYISVIGTRAPTAYGRMATERITADLVDAGAVIISGLARGIDALAHRTALSRKGLTIAVVAHGVDLVYPAEHRGLIDQIAGEGLVISEHPPGTPPLRQYFPARNRMLSGLADAVAIMEASRVSGTMITASFAGDQGREVFAVPGSIFAAQCQGCNQLIREGAGVLESAEDLLRLRASVSLPPVRLSAGQRQACQTAPGGTAQPAVLSPQDRTWLGLMSGSPLTLVEAAAASGRTISETAAWLSYQELNGLVCCDRGRYTLTERAFFCI